MIYFIQAENGHIKIGFTDGEDANVRLATLQTGSPVLLKLLGTIEGTVEHEKDLHRRFAAHRVHGEWFQAIPELLELIPPGIALACDGKTVTEKSISIKVLTVGRKQFTKALMAQLPVSAWLSWELIAEDFTDALPTLLFPSHDKEGLARSKQQMIQLAETVDLAKYLCGGVWGWISERGTVNGNSDFSRVIIFERDGVLYKSFDTRPPYVKNKHVDGRVEQFLLTLFNRRSRIAGLTPTDQLFIGV